MRKRDVYGEIHNLLVKNYGHENAGKMFLYMVQKIQGVNYGDSNKILKQELTFLRNSPKRSSKIGAIFNMD